MKQTQKELSFSTSSEQDRLSKIYYAAAQIICEKGFDAMSMSDIAEAVGITKSGLYHYVSGKNNLLFQIINFGLDEIEEKVMVSARTVSDAEQRLRTIITNHVRLITSRSTPQGINPVTIVMEEVSGLNPANRRIIANRKRAYLDLIRNTLEQLRNEGKLHKVDVTTAAFSLLGMTMWLSRWYNPSGRLKPKEVAEEVTQIALRSVLAPKYEYKVVTQEEDHPIRQKRFKQPILANVHYLVGQSAELIQSQFGSDQKWTQINRAIWEHFETHDERLLSFSDLKHIASITQTSIDDTLSVLGLLAALPKRFIRLVYYQRRNSQLRQELSHEEIVAQSRHLYAEGNIDKWRSWAANILIGWEPDIESNIF